MGKEGFINAHFMVSSSKSDSYGKKGMEEVGRAFYREDRMKWGYQKRCLLRG